MILPPKCSNIFDEMYYAALIDDPIPYSYTTYARYSNCAEYFDYFSRESIFNTIEDGIMFVLNDEAVSKEYAFANYIIYPEDGVISFSTGIRFPTEPEWRAEIVRLSFVYDLKEKIITFQPIQISSSSNVTSGIQRDSTDSVVLLPYFEKYGVTKEMIEEYKKYYLQEVIFTFWTEGNGNASKFTVENPGEFTIVDNSYINLGEDWQD
ncbi:MAG: hypothetical protein R3Y67_02455 [Eubacteriales bacterium]